MTSLGVDCSQSVGGNALIQAGYRFAARYLSRYPGPKVLKAPERDQLLAAGVDIVLVYEDNTTDAMMGASGGTNNAYRALKMAADLGAPHGMCIYFACDQNDATAAQVTPYYTAIRSVISPDYQVGFYGAQAPAAALLAAGTVDKAWVVETWRQGYEDGPLDPFHLMQLVGTPVVVAGTTCDEDQALQDNYGGWLQPQTPKGHPVDQRYHLPTTIVDIRAGVAPDGTPWALVLGEDGGVFAEGDVFHGSEAGDPNFAGRKAARLWVKKDGTAYTIEDTADELYRPDGGAPFRGDQ